MSMLVAKLSSRVVTQQQQPPQPTAQTHAIQVHDKSTALLKRKDSNNNLTDDHITQNHPHFV
jgi:hypothetical protein